MVQIELCTDRYICFPFRQPGTSTKLSCEADNDLMKAKRRCSWVKYVRQRVHGCVEFSSLKRDICNIDFSVFSVFFLRFSVFCGILKTDVGIVF